MMPHGTFLSPKGYELYEIGRLLSAGKWGKRYPVTRIASISGPRLKQYRQLAAVFLHASDVVAVDVFIAVGVDPLVKTGSILVSGVADERGHKVGLYAAPQRRVGRPR
jgi:hypothetical protein